jgi:glycerol-3-phosphate dehydrogenase (NAD(P)+)
LKEHLDRITASLKGKYIISAIKGIVPDENMLINEYFTKYHSVHRKNILVITGACHAEEIAMEHLSYQTIVCRDLKKAKALSQTIFNTSYMKSACSKDITGLEYVSVLKNIYAIVSGICNGLKFGDNFQAVFVPNAFDEMMRFVQRVDPKKRNIANAAYLSDLLVTAYSAFSRNHVFGKMIGEGYSVRAAIVELGMVAEGYYAVKCIYEINERYKVDMPILNAAYAILYDKMSPLSQIKKITEVLK